MLGREVLLPATLIAQPPQETHTVTVPFVADLRDCIRDAHSRIRKATQATAKTQKAYYDNRVREQSFHIDQLVWLYWPSPPRRQKFRKLQQVWTGPWRITEFKSDVVVVLRHFRKASRQTVHVNRLSPYTGTDPPNSTVSATPSEEPLATSSQIGAETEHQSSPLSATPPPLPLSDLAVRPRRKRRPPVALESYVV